jgi:hypothetical protein
VLENKGRSHQIGSLNEWLPPQAPLVPAAGLQAIITEAAALIS